MVHNINAAKIINIKIKKAKGKIMDIYKDNWRQMPLAFNMALCQNMAAMEYFNTLSLQHQQEIIDQTRDISSKDEMRRFVDGLSGNSNN